MIKILNIPTKSCYVDIVWIQELLDSMEEFQTILEKQRAKSLQPWKLKKNNATESYLPQIFFKRFCI
jgi:hypothetical protein